jgi:thiamine-monophosphate kinase
VAVAGGEDALLAWLRARLGPPASGLLGDDAAMVRLAARGSRGEEWALTVDSQIEGTHFLPGLDPALVAARLLAVNFSDLAAVGAAPSLALLALAAPAGFDHRRFFRALGEGCRRAGVTLAGGDLARAPQVVATMTLLGRRRPGGRWLRRDAGRAGDALWVGGTLGESALGRLLLARGAALQGRHVALPAGLALGGTSAVAARRAVKRHLQPSPQLALSAALARRRRCACLDVSDGLARDLSRLCAASGVGATIEAAALPLPRGAVALAAALGADSLALALGGGEDYVLLFALPPREAAPAGCTRIGMLEARGGMRLRTAEGVASLPPRGWDHLAGERPPSTPTPQRTNERKPRPAVSQPGGAVSWT